MARKASCLGAGALRRWPLVGYLGVWLDARFSRRPQAGRGDEHADFAKREPSELLALSTSHLTQPDQEGHCREQRTIIRPLVECHRVVPDAAKGDACR